MTEKYKTKVYVAVIGAFAIIAAAIISNSKNRQSTISKKGDIIVADSSNNFQTSETASLDNKGKEEVKSIQPANTLVSNLDAKKAWEDINNSPPYQQKQVSKNYYGIKVNWDVVLEGIVNQGENKILVISLYKGSFPYVYFTTDVSKYPILKTSKKDTHFNITGTISGVEFNGFEIILEKMK